MKTPLRAERAALEKLWEQGLSGQALLRGHSRLADEFIQECFQKTDLPGAEESVALVALGGYGRQELFPFSDIDLMILYRPELKEEVGKVADSVLYPLWDTGLEVGHGVRTVQECVEQAREDFYFQVALLDARLISGSQLLFFELQSEYKEKFVEGKREWFVRNMKLFRDERCKRFGSHSYLLEPHIKEGKGGFRDIQAMLWTAKVVYGLEGLTGIVNAGILTGKEQAEFVESWDTLVKIRNRLHYISTRKNDQLYFEQQEEMAEAFGYTARKGMLAVETFMRETYRHLQTVAVTTDLFFEHVDEVLGLAGKGDERYADKVLEKGIELRNNHLHLTSTAKELQAKPHLLMRVFLAASRLGVPVHHRTKKTITSSLDLVTDKVRGTSRMSTPFFTILENAKDIFGVLTSMLETGLLVAYIPEFERVITLVQHDVYHIYTVDRHSVQAVAELREVVRKEELVYRGVRSPRILFLAMLLHDIGKGAGGDHSLVGAELIVGIGERLGLSEAECECLGFLVKHHLFIPENALRRDLNDTVFIKRCAETIGDVDRLSMLYLLSIADSKATGPSAWSDWKATLLQEMFLKVQPYLEMVGYNGANEGSVERHVEEGVEWLRDQVRELVSGKDDLRMDVNDLSADYLLSFTPEAVSEHIEIYRDNYRLLRQKSIIVSKDKGEQWSLLIMATDQSGLLAKICGVMALNNLTVLNAQIFTWVDGTVVDVIDVHSTDGLTFSEKDWQGLNQDLDLAIAHRLGLGHRLYRKLSNTYGRRKELVGKRESRVVIDNNTSDHYSVVEVYADDLQGQLYHITQTLADFGINIHKAFIATEVDQLIDVFYVLDKDDLMIEDHDFKEEIVQGLLYSLGRER